MPTHYVHHAATTDSAPLTVPPHTPRTGKAFHYATEGLAPALGSWEVRNLVAELTSRGTRRQRETDGAAAAPARPHSPHAPQRDGVQR